MALRLPFQDIHRPRAGGSQKNIKKKTCVYHLPFIYYITYHDLPCQGNIYKYLLKHISTTIWRSISQSTLPSLYRLRGARAQRAQRAALPGLVVLDVDAPWFASRWWNLGESPNWKKGHPAIPPASQRVHRNSGMKLMKRWDLLIFQHLKMVDFLHQFGANVDVLSKYIVKIYCQNILSKYKLWWTIG